MPKIIICEDDPMISEIYQKKFKEAGFNVLKAESGEEVLKQSQKEKPDIILLDLVMPKMDGFEVIENLRTKNYSPEIKIIVFSNLSQTDDREKALRLGADGFLVKADYAPSDLVKEVQRLLEQFQEEKKNEIRLNGNSSKSENSQIVPGKKPSPPSGKKILMIEDEDVFVEMFGEKLRKDGYLVTFAKNGVWGMKEALQGEYDLFVIDMMMPNMTGDEIVERLKMEEKTKNKPIIILSASVEKDEQEKVEAMGVSAFYLKTQLIPSELSKKVEELLN